MFLLLLALLLAGSPEPPAFLNINPSWSPDGRFVVFETRRHGEPQIYVMEADGSGLRRLTRNASSDTHPVWTPDGREIVFDSHRDGTWNLHAIRPDGTGERQLTFPGDVRTKAFARHPAISPDGRKVAFDSDRDGREQVYVMDLKTGATGRLTHADAHEGHAAWSPDGGTIWFGSNRGGTVDVWRVGVDGASPTAVVAGPAKDAGVKPSPDGRRIAYFAGGEKPDIFVADADGTDSRNLTNSPAATEYEMNWSPDGRRLAFYSDRTGRYEIYVVDVDGGNLVQLTETPWP